MRASSFPSSRSNPASCPVSIIQENIRNQVSDMSVESIRSELKNILGNYNLGELVGFEQDRRGTVNTSFTIEMEQDDQRRKYFLRRYKRGIQEEEILCEHSLINHLLDAQSLPVAHLYPTLGGKTYLHRSLGPDDQEGAFYAIFDFLPGEDRYTWVDPICTPEELVNSAITLAQFHQAVDGFQPVGKRLEPKILDLLPVISHTLTACPEKVKSTDFDTYLLENLELVLKDIDSTLAVLEESQVSGLPQMVVHCDYHPGNLKFQQSRVSGLFDFDWSKVDLRSFDVGLALWYFCASWKALNDGELRLADLEAFLGAYQGYLRAQPGARPLNSLEAQYLPYLINAGNLYVLNWTILDFYNKDVDPREYLIYLRHGVNFTRWFEAAGNLEQLKALIHTIIEPEG
jgi:homoserine kinase type II